MARSMIERRRQAERERIEAYEATLRRVGARTRETPDFARAIAEARRGLADEAVRPGHLWQPKMKTRDPARLRLAAARHLFATYRVPAPLERVWIGTDGLDPAEIALRKRWYVIVARGGSLYREAAREWLTRKEVHAFLNPPGDLGFEEAFWQAITRSYTEDAGVALRIARSKIARTPRAELAFWREVARFFAVNPVPLTQIDDLCDFLSDQHRRDRGWSLKGRTLASLERLSLEWHRDIAAIARIEAVRRRHAHPAARQQGVEGGRWKGAALEDWTWRPTAKERSLGKHHYAVVQLTSAEELVAESRAMRHCVWTYASKCITGNATIWSLRRIGAGGREPLLTIELDRQHRAVQVRGFANRVALPDEMKVLERWAKARGITLP